MPYYIYQLTTTNLNGSNTRYVGSTPDPKRRIKQHNGLLSGGAKATRSKLSNAVDENTSLVWNFGFVIMTFLKKADALSMEWHIKKPFHHANKKRTIMSKDVNVMLSQIDTTIKYVCTFREISYDKINPIILFIDKKMIETIKYTPINYTIMYIYELTTSIVYNDFLNYFKIFS